MTSPAEITEEELRGADCLFAVDRVPRDPATTRFKREARYRQAMWRESRGLAKGSHRNLARSIAAGGAPTIPNGSKLDDLAAAEGRNFLSDRVRAAVEDRLQTPQDHQTLDEVRLRSDLLSSMPMCFNLFGELHGDPSRTAAVAARLMPSGDGPSAQVVFEWSPGRRDRAFTGDRTAFDAAILIGDAGSPRRIIGIETKYHEHALVESRSQRVGQEERYLEIARASQAFKSGWEGKVLETELRQVWRDHLLVLSMLQRPDAWSDGRYVLVYPARNSSFAGVARDYQNVLRDDSTFAAVTIEELLDAHVLHDLETESLFRERYIW